MTAQRKNDAVFILKQDNTARMLTLVEADAGAAELLGAAPDALKNKPLFAFLAPKAVEYFADSIDYEPEGADFGEVSQKLRDIRLKDAAGKEFVTPFRVDMIDSPDGMPWYRLVVPSDSQRQLRHVIAQYLQQHFEGAMVRNAETGLPSGNAAEAYVGMLKNTLPLHQMQGCCALLRVDRYEKSLARYGRGGVLTQLQHVANCCKSTFRAEDIICQLDDHTLAMFLVDIDQDAARIVLNRLRWNIRNHRIVFGGKEDFSVTVSIVFGSLLSEGKPILQRCTDAIHAIGADERNLLSEVGA